MSAPTVDGDVAISAVSLKKTYRRSKRTAVDGIDLTIKKGELVSIIGSNGAGKSTLLNLFACGTGYDSGELNILGKDAARNWKTIVQKIGYLPQNATMFGKLTVKENLNYFMTLRSESADIGGIVDRMGIRALMDMRMDELSGGQRQRACIACTLLGSPQLILLDEPSTGLDTESKKETWELFSDLRKNGCTVIVTTHDIQEAEVFSDRIISLEEGHVVYDGAPSGLTSELTVSVIDAGTELDGMYGMTERNGNVLIIQPDDASDLARIVTDLVAKGVPKENIKIGKGWRVGE